MFPTFYYRTTDSFFDNVLDALSTKFESQVSYESSPDDILDYKDKYVISIEAPGVSKESISVTYENNKLKVVAEKPKSYKEDDVGRLTASRKFGKIEKIYKVPSHIDVNKISASYVDGVITIELMKSEDQKPKTIEVK